MSQGERADREVEATLVVFSEAPAELAAELAGLERVGPYRLRWRGEADLRDVYFDTPEAGLRDRGLALRLRREDGAWTLTVKRDARRAGADVVERSEVEGTWSDDGVARVARKLEERGVDAAGLRSAAGEAPAVEALRRAGHRVVQDRRTVRRRAGVLPPGADGEPVAELAVDTVRFHVSSGRTVLHREVEVEAAPAASAGVCGSVAGALRERFPGALRPWPHSKLATGAALAESDPPAAPGGDLRPGAYVDLERRIAGGGRQG